ncbi:MAG TPA: FAD-dependent oxidoreductase [Rhizobacter sp.]
MSGLRIAIAGAGVLGRLLAWRLARDGHTVQVVDPAHGPEAPPLGNTLAHPVAAGYTAAGLLSPLAELDHAEPELAALGWRSILRWRDVVAALAPQAPQTLLRVQGSLLVAHSADLGSALRVMVKLRSAAQSDPGAWPAPEIVPASELRVMEPELLPGLSAWWLPGEGQLEPRLLLDALAAQAPGVHWHWGQRVTQVHPGCLQIDARQRITCDLAIDVRGLGARGDKTGPGTHDEGSGLRGVRGELVWLHAPGVNLRHPVRLLHPRHRVYIVPRAHGHIVVGASEIESEDRSPVSLRSAVELMAAAHSVLPGLAEARIVHLDTNLRPAWPDHRPRIESSPGLLRITGLYRHGWLLAPALVDDALAQAFKEPQHA